MDNQEDPTVLCSGLQLPNLNLTADVLSAEATSRFTLMGKILSKKIVSSNIIQMIIRRVWFTQETVKIKSLAMNTFLLSFNALGDGIKYGEKDCGPLIVLI